MGPTPCSRYNDQMTSSDLNQDLSSTAAVKSRTYAVGAKHPAGSAGKVLCLLQVINPENGKPLDIASLRYTHTLSRRTDIYSQINVANDPAAKAYGVRSEFMLGVHYRFDLLLWGN